MEMQIRNRIADIVIISKDRDYVWLNIDEQTFSRKYRERYDKRINSL